MDREEALRKVRQMSLPKETMEILQALAPELAESEDERIRKWLVDYFSSIDKAWIHKDITCIDILRWLEKQKEKKPAEWSEEDEENLEKVIWYIEKGCKLIFQKPDKLISWLKSLPLNLKKKNEDVAKLCSNEWSEEDETALGDLMWCIEQARKSAKDENDMGNIWFAENWVKNRLKSLRPQYHGDVTMTEAYKMGKEAGEASSWKPSEEQMEALNEIVNILAASPFLHQNDYLFNILNGLREELKKLL